MYVCKTNNIATSIAYLNCLKLTTPSLSIENEKGKSCLACYFSSICTQFDLDMIITVRVICDL